MHSASHTPLASQLRHSHTLLLLLPDPGRRAWAAPKRAIRVGGACKSDVQFAKIDLWPQRLDYAWQGESKHHQYGRPEARYPRAD